MRVGVGRSTRWPAATLTLTLAAPHLLTPTLTITLIYSVKLTLTLTLNRNLSLSLTLTSRLSSASSSEPSRTAGPFLTATAPGKPVQPATPLKSALKTLAKPPCPTMRA